MPFRELGRLEQRVAMLGDYDTGAVHCCGGAVPEIWGEPADVLLLAGAPLVGGGGLVLKTLLAPAGITPTFVRGFDRTRRARLMRVTAVIPAQHLILADAGMAHDELPEGSPVGETWNHNSYYTAVACKSLARP